MFKNKTASGRLNISGSNIARLRKERQLSQRELADQLQLMGIDMNKNAIQRIESGQRFVTDIELQVFGKFFNIHCDALLGKPDN